MFIIKKKWNRNADVDLLEKRDWTSLKVISCIQLTNAFRCCHVLYVTILSFKVFIFSKAIGHFTGVCWVRGSCRASCILFGPQVMIITYKHHHKLNALCLAICLPVSSQLVYCTIYGVATNLLCHASTLTT